MYIYISMALCHELRAQKALTGPLKYDYVNLKNVIFTSSSNLKFSLVYCLHQFVLIPFFQQYHAHLKSYHRIYISTLRHGSFHVHCVTVYFKGAPLCCFHCVSSDLWRATGLSKDTLLM